MQPKIDIDRPSLTAAAARLRWVNGSAAWLRGWIAAERGRFVLFVPVCLVGGVLLYFALGEEPAQWTGAEAIVAGASIAITWRANVIARACGLIIVAGAVGFTAAQLATFRAPALLVLPRTAVVIEGVVQMVERLPEGQRITIEAPRLGDQAVLSRSLRIKLRASDLAELQTGDDVKVRALLGSPPPPAYPGGWDLQRDAWFSGMGGYGYALNPVERRAPSSGFDHTIETYRERVAARINSVLPGSDGAIAATLLTGMAAGISATDRAAFRGSGLSHLLAIAGLHVGIVMGLVMAATRLALALSERAALHWPIKQIAAMAALFAGAGYMVLTGMHVPIIRSFAMACLVTIGLLVGRRAISLRGLMLAATLLILVAPEQLVGVSMQMSFSAVLALIAGFEALRPWLNRLYGKGWRHLLSYVVGLALTSLLAGGASAPFAAYHFGQIQLYFVVANMLAVPLAALWVMPAGLAALVAMPIGLDKVPLLVMGAGVHGILWIGREVASWPAATFSVPHAPDWGIGVLSLGIAWMGLWRSRIRLIGLPLMLLGSFSPVLVKPPDLLVSSDAKLIAFRTSQGIIIQSKSTSRFIEASWRQYWGSDMVQRIGQNEMNADINCTTQSCLLRSRPNGPAAILARGSVEPERCLDAQVIVSSEPIRGACGGLLPIIDRFTVWRDGAQAVWLKPTGVVVSSDRADRGTRPWVRPTPLYETATTLPMAKAEDN